MFDAVSLVIPCRDDDIHIFAITLKAIKLQDVLPNEIIIIDSSEKNEIKDFLSNHELSGLIKLHSIKPSFAGLSTNIGIKNARNELIALLDTKTVPSRSWLKEYLVFIQNEKVDIVFGNTFFGYTNSFQRAVRAASYGAVGHETVPGSLFYKNIACNIKFQENLRAGYDIDWRERVKESYSWYLPTTNFINYDQFPNSIYDLVKKYFYYSFYTGFISSQKRLKDLYFSLLLAITALIIPRWNLMLEGWDQNDLYIPDITKKYALSLIIIFLIISLVSLIFRNNIRDSLGYKTLQFLVFIFLFYSVFRWNAEIALWAEDAVLYIPHITKLFILFIISSSIIVRGIVKPLQRKEDMNYIFPFRWLLIGVIGLIMDLAKAPGFIFGSIRGRINHFMGRVIDK
ncbi:MAG: glycosyltransferase [Gammaproteobacteria bacterium]